MRMHRRTTRPILAIVVLATLAAFTAVLPASPSAGAQSAGPEASGDPSGLVTSDGTVVTATDGGPVGGGDSFAGTAPDGVATNPTPAPVIPPGTSSPGNPITPGSGSESILGPDGRTQVNATTSFPSRAIGQITFSQGGSFICTGFLIDPNTVVASGHCVNSGGLGSGAGWSTNVTFSPGRNGASNPYGTCNGINLAAFNGWLASGDEYEDIGLIQLDCNIGTTVGWFGLFSEADAYLLNTPETVRGYPGDKPSGTMWTMNDEVRALEPNMVFYQSDTIGGQSGSPVYQYDPSGCDGPCAMAVHGYGVGHGATNHQTNNHGPRITASRRTSILNFAATNCSGHTFGDVDMWADEAVDWTTCFLLMDGFAGNLFKPYDSITRAQVARLLYRIAGSPSSAGLPAHGFVDVPAWVDDAVKWLVDNDYATGFGNQFRPNIPITRAAVTRMLFRIAGEPGGSPQHSFTDVPDWVNTAVNWIVDPANVPPYASGFGDKFKPLDNINRAQTARMTCRIEDPVAQAC